MRCRWAARCTGSSRMSDLARLDITRLRADNPGPFTLTGTNTWVVGRDPAWVIDPGPDLSEHLDAVAAEVEARGGAGGIAVTHDHLDHVEGVLALRDRLGRPPVAAAASRPTSGSARASASARSSRTRPRPRAGPLHLRARRGVLHRRRRARGGQRVRRGRPRGLPRRARAPARAAARGHLPRPRPPVWEPRAKLEHYIAHRQERERKLLAALDDGLRDEDELLDAVWDDAPAALRPAAAVTLGAHREKLQAEGRWPQRDGGTPAP